MSTWVYLASESGVGVEDTMALAVDVGVIVRAFFIDGEALAAGSNLKHLAADDLVILAFTHGGSIEDAMTVRLVDAQGRYAAARLNESQHQAVRRYLRRDGTIPNPIGVPNEHASAAIVRAGYGDDRQDPRVGDWTVLCVEEADEEPVDLAALNDWYAGVSNKQTPLHPLVRPDPTTGTAAATAPSPTSTVARAVPNLVMRTAAAGRVGRELPEEGARSSSAAADRIGVSADWPRRILGPGLGVDFSGGAAAARKTWIAVVTVRDGRPVVTRLNAGLAHADVVAHVTALTEGVALIDFPFGLAAQTCDNLGVAAGNPFDVWDAVAACGDADSFRARCRKGRFGAGTERPHRRAIDVRRQSPWAPINLRLYRQTFHGICRVLLPLARADVQIFPWAADVPYTGAKPWIGEGCPACSLRARGLPVNGYKGAGGQCRERRSEMMRAIEGHYALAFDSPSLRDRVIGDSEGDAMDALILAIAASQADADQVAESAAHADAHPSEAFIFV